MFHAYTAHKAAQVRQQLVEDEALRWLSVVVAEKQRIIEGAEQVLDAIAGSPALADGRVEDCRRLLGNIQHRQPRYANIMVAGSDGRAICSSLPQGMGHDLSDRDYFRKARQTNALVVGTYMTGRTSGLSSFALAKALIAPDGSFGGIAEVSLSLDWLELQLSKIPLPPNAVARISDRNGVVLATTPLAGRFTGTPMAPQNRFTLDGNAPGVRLGPGLDGQTRLIAYDPPGDDGNGLAVGIGLDPDTMSLGSTGTDRVEMLLIIAGGGLALAITALVGNSLIRRPVARLLVTAAQWRAGALGQRTGLRRDGGEFAELGAAFDDMAEALENRQRAAGAALESTTDAVIVVDHAWRLIYINQKAHGLTGDGGLAGQSLWSVFPSLEKAEFAMICQGAIQSGKPAKVETRCPRTGGQFETNVYPSDEELTLYIRDVSEERRVAAALRESEQRVGLITRAAGIGVWERDLTTGATIWSDATWRLHGLDPRPGGPDAATFLATIHPDDRDAVAEHRRASVEPGQVYTFEARVVWRDGTVRWLMTRFSVLQEPKGSSGRVVGISIDMTASRAAEAALRQSETRLRLAREIAGFGVWERDLAGTRIVWSDELWRLYGMELRLQAPSLSESLAMVHPDDIGNVIDAQQRLSADPPEQHTFVYRVIWPDGTVRWLQTAAALVSGPSGDRRHVIGLAFDVTETRETEAALRRLTAELEQRVQDEVAAREAAQLRLARAERVQALGQLAGGIAHDFNNILQAMSGAITLIRRRSGDAATVQRLTRMAEDAADRGASITRRLLTFGRRDELDVEAFDARLLLQGLREVLVPTLGAAFTVDVRTAAALPPVFADKRQLETVLVNLATNARDAMPAGGELVLAADAERVAGDHPAGLPPGAYVRLSVTDTGTGMEPEILARAREPFFTTKKLGAGTGLGLTMAHSFADQSGGAMVVDSRLGEGTTVTLWLPRADTPPPAIGPEMPPAATQPQTPPAAIANAAASFVRQRILLVDDEAPIRSILSEYLALAGYDVLSAANGAAALAMLQAEPAVDGLITDLSMPGMDGLAVIRAVRASHPDMPAILLTGYAGDDAALALGRLFDGAVSLMRKPVTDDQLLDRLSAMLAAGGPATRPARVTQEVC